MKLYKLRHKKTGLYFCPRRFVQIKFDGQTYWIKSNLSKKGKLYQQDPRNKIQIVYDHTKPYKFDNGWGYQIYAETYDFNKEDFELVEFSANEVPITQNLFSS